MVLSGVLPTSVAHTDAVSPSETLTAAGTNTVAGGGGGGGSW